MLTDLRDTSWGQTKSAATQIQEKVLPQGRDGSCTGPWDNAPFRRGQPVRQRESPSRELEARERRRQKVVQRPKRHRDVLGESPGKNQDETRAKEGAGELQAMGSDPTF